MTRHRDERGAVAVFVAVTMSLLLVVAAFAVDLGTQRVVRRDMQALADVVALDLARELGRRTQAELAVELDRSSPTSALSVSLSGNQSTLGDNLVVTPTWGAWDGVTFDTTADPPTAVRVTASADVGFSFGGGRGSATRQAYAVSSTSACHKLGSVAAAVRSGQSTLLAPLNDLLGLNASLLTYQGIAGADVSLAQLTAAGLVGTENALLGGTVSFANLVSATIAALNTEKAPGYQAAVSALASFTAIQGGVPAVQLAKILSIAPTDTAALETGLNVLDLLSAAVMVANGAHAVAIPNLQSGVPGLGNQFTGQLYVQEPAQLGCGAPNSVQARASTSQLSGTVGLDFVNLPTIALNTVLDLGLVKGTLQTDKAKGALKVDIGNAESQLIDPPEVYCGAGTASDPHTMSVTVASGLTKYELSADVRLSGTIRVAGVRVDVDALVGVKLASPSPAPSVTVGLKIPPNDVVPVETGGNPRVLTELTAEVKSITAVDSLLGISLNLAALGSVSAAIVNALLVGDQSFASKALAPLAANIDSMLIGPLVELLGLRLGGADVYAISTACNIPSLRG